MRKVVIIGGGIAGLTTAFFLQESARDWIDSTIIESAPRFGGKIISTHERGFVVEGGPDSFPAHNPTMMSLCQRLGLGDQLIGSNSEPTATYVWSRGRLHPLPAGMMLMAPTMVLPFLRSGLISWRGKLRMGCDLFIPRRPEDGDESLASFVRRRLGTELLDTIAAPLMAGIYAADPELLSLHSTFPMFHEMEKTHGSLIGGMIKQRWGLAQADPRRAQAPMAAAWRGHEKSGPSPSAIRSPPSSERRGSDPAQGGEPLFMTLRGGLQQLSDAIVSRLNGNALRLNCRALSVDTRDGQYTLALSDGSRLLADDIIFATPAPVTAGLVQHIAPELASRLRMLRYVSTATVSLGFNNSEIGGPWHGFGFVVPQGENRKITACSWSSSKFNHRAPPGCSLVRVFVGGSRAGSLAEQDEAALVELAQRELGTILGITATPLLTKVYRWTAAIPQYDVGHQARIAEIEAITARHRGWYLAGSPYHGVGVPKCIQSAARIANAITRTRQDRREQTSSPLH